MSIVVSKEDVRTFEKLLTISQIAPIKERIRTFEKKYGYTFEEFEDRMKKEDEDFEKWDDYIEWKAYTESLRNLESKLRAIESAKDIRVS
ncbi:hypothetical protein IBX65_08880 [Candidatus Aerophobetes bacterium]|nr:hypothetical protein [Candidatus Aerophobetes bacterium]